MSVVIYTTPTCGFCHQAKIYFKRQNVHFSEIDVSRDQHAAIEMVTMSGQQGVPVIVIDGQIVLGFNQPAIDQLLQRRASHPPKLGVAVADAKQVAANKGIQLPEGAYVGRVNVASTAAYAGVRVRDVIVQLAGQPVRTDQDVHSIMARTQHNQSIELRVWRNEQHTTLKAQL
ncbi:MAG: PDZ domain-containing protein [Anaerolineae bacterium]|nr:PDZ domain-containing protein [Anaerolineae bacterium]